MKQTTLQAWLEWKMNCALVKCAEETKRDLGQWGARIFCSAVRKFNPQHELANSSDQRSSGVDPAWSWMEVHLVAGKKSEGKRFKDHLLDCARNEPTDDKKRISLEKYFARSCRNEASRLFGKYSTERTIAEQAIAHGLKLVPLDAPVSDDPSSETFGEIYAGADHEGLTEDSLVAKAELERIANAEALRWFETMTLREKLVYACWMDGRSLNDPLVLSAAGCQHSQFYAVKPKTEASIKRFKETLQSKYGEDGDDKATIDELLLCGMTELSRLCQDLLPPEKSSARPLSEGAK